MDDLKKFTDKAELFDYIDKNYEDILVLKKKTIKNADSIFTRDLIVKVMSDKIDQTGLSKDEVRVKFVGSTYLWMDSHDDVHDLNVFNKSISEQKNKIFHLHDHLYQVAAKVGKIESITEEMVPWKDLGIDKEGDTQCLVIVSVVKKSYNESIFEDYKNEEANQHSVSMRYIIIKLAYASSENKDARDLYYEYLPKIGNREKVEEQGYFFLVKEAALREVSYVLKGSNELTPQLQKTQQVIVTETDKVLDVYKNFLGIK